MVPLPRNLRITIRDHWKCFCPKAFRVFRPEPHLGIGRIHAFGAKFTNGESKASATIYVSEAIDPIIMREFDNTNEQHAEDNANFEKANGVRPNPTLVTSYKSFKAYEDTIGPEEEYVLHVKLSPKIRIDVLLFKLDPKVAREILDRIDLSHFESSEK